MKTANKIENLIASIRDLNIPVKIQIGSVHGTFYPSRERNYFTIEGIIYCQEYHLESLRKMGVKIDFSNKRVGFASNQRHIGSGLNRCAVKVRMTDDVYLLVNKYCRKDGNLDLLNDHHLRLAGFQIKQKFQNTEIEKQSRLSLHLEKISYLRSSARRRKQDQRMKQTGYGYMVSTSSKIK